MIFLFLAILVSIAFNIYFYQLQSSSAELLLAPKKDMTKSVVTIDMYRKGALKEAMAKNSSGIESCYETFLKTEPQVAEGKIVIAWTISTNGRAEDLRLVESELSNEDLYTCLTSLIAKTFFTKPREPTIIAQKFIFKQRSPASLVFE